jgi:hypothetical protein
LSTHDAVAEGVVVDEAAGDEVLEDVLEDVLEHATSTITGTAAATIQRCIARFSPLERMGGKWTGPRGGVLRCGTSLGENSLNTTPTSTDTA